MTSHHGIGPRVILYIRDMPLLTYISMLYYHEVQTMCFYHVINLSYYDQFIMLHIYVSVCYNIVPCASILVLFLQCWLTYHKII